MLDRIPLRGPWRVVGDDYPETVRPSELMAEVCVQARSVEPFAPPPSAKINGSCAVGKRTLPSSCHDSTSKSMANFAVSRESPITTIPELATRW